MSLESYKWEISLTEKDNLNSQLKNIPEINFRFDVIDKDKTEEEGKELKEHFLKMNLEEFKEVFEELKKVETQLQVFK